jgi:hypothetical protein
MGLEQAIGAVILESPAFGIYVPLFSPGNLFRINY